MKELVIIVALIVIGQCRIVPHEIGLTSNIVREITQQGYPVQNITVRTRDGYLLDLIRIPGPREYKEHWDKLKEKKTDKLVVLLMHSLLGSADEFVVGGHIHGLAYRLVQRGFDVFMGNVRGSKYGRKHVSLNPERDPLFWKYSLDEIGLTDLSAIIDQVLTTTGQLKMHYIGNNQGNTIFYILASSKRQYNTNINKMIALGPMAIMKHAHHPLMSFIRNYKDSPQWIAKHVGQHKFSPSAYLKNEVEPDCTQENVDYQVCTNFYFLLNGYSRNLNQTIVPIVADEQPNGASVRQILHYAQLIYTDSLRPFEDTSPDLSDSTSSSSSSSESESEAKLIEAYQLRYVTASTYFLYVPEDHWASRQDIDHLASHLPNVTDRHEFSEYASNVDLLFSKTAYETVYEKILHFLQ